MIKTNAHKYSVSAMCHILQVNRQFHKQEYRNVVVCDLTYVRVALKWNYVCVLVDLFNREIIGYSAREHKTAELVKQAFESVEGTLKEIMLFHTDRGNEFKNYIIEELLETFEIKRSLSHKAARMIMLLQKQHLKSSKLNLSEMKDFMI